MRRRTSLGALTGLVLGVLVLGPALAPGYTLHYDLVHVPDLGAGPRVLGTDGSVPRAVPNDLVVALLSLVLPGWVAQKTILLGCFVVGGAGMGRLSRSGWGAVAGAVLWSWNPWVGERLGIGHWGFVMGYAMLPWVLGACARLRRGEGSLPAAALTVALAGLGGSTAGVLATIVALVVLGVPVAGGEHRPRPGSAVVVLAVSLGANASWWWPFLTAASRAADPDGVPAFASAADTPFGVVGSLALGGGLWNDRTWFVERQTLLVAGLALVLVLAVLTMALRRRAWWQEPAKVGATGAGLVGLALAAVAAVPGGEDLVTGLVTSVPGAGLLRDGQKFAALWLLLVAVALVHVVDGLATSVAGPRVLLVVAVAAPVATLPSLAWGHAGRWGSVDYPSGMLDVAAQLEEKGDPVAVLPWSTYRRYSWNGDRVVLDPWNRLLPQEVLSDDQLRLRDATVAGEDPDAREVSEAVRTDGDVVAALRGAGVRYVVVHSDQPDPEGSVPDLGQPVRVEQGLEVYRLDGPPQAEGSGGPGVPVGMALTGATLVLVGVAAAGRRRDESPTHRDPDHGRGVARK